MCVSLCFHVCECLCVCVSLCVHACICVYVCVFLLQVTEGLHCVSPELCELTSGTLTLSLEVPEETAVK